MSESIISGTIQVCGRDIEFRRIAGARAAPELVFLHEGLGSITQWRDFPEQVARQTGLPAIVYARYGHGRSSVLQQAHAVDFMHREALAALPELLQKLEIERPLLIGHSDGASIALIHAGAGHAVHALVVMAPHVFVEDISIRGIEAARRAFEQGDLPARLARHHRDAHKTFHGWNDVWLSPQFRSWNIEAYLPRIACPLLAIQGEDDEYGSMAQVDAIARQVAGPVQVLKLAACGHSPQRDQAPRVTEAVVRFVRSCMPA